MIAFAILGSVFCLLLGIDKICDRLDNISDKLDKYKEEKQ
jgi:hypothetical protein